MGTIKGIDDTLKALDNLPSALRRKALRKALQAGGKVVQKKAVSNLLSQQSDEATGQLAKNIVIRVLKTKNKIMRIAVIIAGKKINRKGVRLGLIGSVFELGDANQPARPFLRPAAKESVSEVLNVVTAASRSELSAAVEAAKNGT